MSNSSKDVNGLGEKATTAIPENVPLAKHSGHRLRTSRKIVDRKALAKMKKEASSEKTDTKKIEKLSSQKVEYVQIEGETGIIRKPMTEENGCAESAKQPNQFTGPSPHNKNERFRFDGHKMMHHLDRIAAWQKSERFSPIHIDMGLTKFCNTACLYYYAVVQNMTNGTMIGREPLLGFIKDCGKLGVRSIGFIGDGEPTLNPTVYDAAILARESGIDTSMATNGILIDMDRADDLLRNMSWIRFNLSADEAEGFHRVHQSAEKNFDLLIEKIRMLVKIKKDNGYPYTLKLQMVLIPECFDQVIKEAELGAELGVDYFIIKHCSDSEYKEIGIDYKTYLKLKDTLKQAESLSTDDYTVQVKWNKIMASNKTKLYKDGFRKYDVCYGTPFLLQISGNGKVYPCGPFFNKERFYIGDLHEGSFFDLVMSDRYWEVHEDISRSVDVHKDCAIGCRQDYINKFLWDLKNKPEHINFI